MKKIITRFAPSPTGFLHLGSIRSAIFSYIFARQNQGTFILRIDDTDKERSKSEYRDSIFENLQWLGIDFDITFNQSDRKNLYDDIFNLLKENGYLYECFETEEELENIKNLKKAQKKAPIITKEDCIKEGKNGYWRFEIKNNSFELNDIVFGKMKFNKNWSDLIVRKSDNSYTYSFASVVDDIFSGVTHIIRGEDHINNTIYQREIGDAICNLKFNSNWNVNFAHYSIFLDEDGSKMSKRKLSGSINDMKEFINPWTIWSIITYLGTNNNQVISTDKDIFIKNFNLSNLSKSKQKLSEDLIMKTNGKVLRKIIEETLFPKEIDSRIWNLLRDNAVDLEDLYRNIKNFQNFMNSDSELKKSIIDNSFDSDNVSRENISTKIHSYKEIYNLILKKDYGPKIKDLFHLIKVLC